MIHGVVLKSLKIIRDERGQVMHMLRADDELFKRFGEIYFSVINPGVIKGWKKHQKITQHFAVPQGNIKIVLYDDREDSATKGEIQEIVVGEKNYQLLRIPPQVWYGFGSTDDHAALIANCTDFPHDPAESIQIAITDQRIPYPWK